MNNTYNDLKNKAMNHIDNFYNLYKKNNKDIFIDFNHMNYQIYFRISLTTCNFGILFNNKSFRLYSEPKDNGFLLKGGKGHLFTQPHNLPYWLQRSYDRLDTLIEEYLLRSL